MREKLCIMSGRKSRLACHSAQVLASVSAFDSERSPGQG